ncbi:NUDIX domain-containing protein [Agitococcus lubricus]|uniref:ADP-ribose pyrophosphatase n=1 Tax=Agitococcus lubricus TaxID=1077255 RepID=A0A2T5J129_9GAMM|nr:NUDIX domain-containing protein [Agitococcus lubricus]PTQ89999.1 ADP-ribose pyrophosphatase [Agitococcus lubricus]
MEQTLFKQTHDVEHVERKTLFQGFNRIDVLRLKHRLFSGQMGTVIQRELMVKPQAVGVLIYDPVLASVLLIEQFRVGALAEDNPWLLEIVAGLVDAEQESLEQVVRREAQEEAGISLLHLEFVQRFYLTPGCSSECLHLFVAQADLSQAGGIYGLPEEGEDIRACVVEIAQLQAYLTQGRLINATTVIAAQWLLLNEVKLRTRWQKKENFADL